jgi:hypothetical protein
VQQIDMDNRQLFDACVILARSRLVKKPLGAEAMQTFTRPGLHAPFDRDLWMTPNYADFFGPSGGPSRMYQNRVLQVLLPTLFYYPLIELDDFIFWPVFRHIFSHDFSEIREMNSKQF